MRRLWPALLLVSCADAPMDAPERRGVYTVNYPLLYFAERITQGGVDASLPVPDDVDPAFWRPADAAVADYQQAELILLNGASYAKWVAHVSLPPSRCVDTSAGFDYIAVKDRTMHTHGPAAERDHGGIASITWLDFMQAAAQARAVRDALARTGYSTNGYAELERDLVDLDRRMREIVTKAPIVASHPVYQYWARRYGANLRSVHWEPNEAPDWAELEAVLETHPAKWMIWEGEPLAGTKEKLRARGIDSVVFAPCGNVPGDGDFIEAMRRSVDRLAQAFR